MKRNEFVRLSRIVLFAVLILSYSHASAATQATNACYNNATGALRLLVSGSSCDKSSETSISLNIVGVQGPQGPKGPQGPTGDKGPQGQQGPTGLTGPTGPAGPRGVQGPAGLAWKGAWANTTAYSVNDVVSFNGSAYICIAANSKIQPDGNTADWKLLAKKGDQGPAGQQGAQGTQGPQGPTGPKGATGPQGTPGVTGNTGSQGPTGPQGLKGPTGPKGDAGSSGVSKVYDGAGQFLGNLIDFSSSGNYTDSQDTQYIQGAILVYNPQIDAIISFHYDINNIIQECLDSSTDCTILYDTTIEMSNYSVWFDNAGCTGKAYLMSMSGKSMGMAGNLYYKVIEGSSPKIGQFAFGSVKSGNGICTDSTEDAEQIGVGAFYAAEVVPVGNLPFTLPLTTPLVFQFK